MRCQQEASDPSTTSERLLELARRPECMALVAQNPNIPLSLASGLVGWYPAEILQNASLSLWLLESPETARWMINQAASYLLSKDRSPNQERLVRCFLACGRGVFSLLDSARPEVLCALVRFENSPEALILAAEEIRQRESATLQLFQEPTSFEDFPSALWEWLFCLPKAPWSLLFWALSTRYVSPKVWEAAARHPDASPKDLLWIAGYRGSEKARLIACQRPDAPRVLQKLVPYHRYDRYHSPPPQVFSAEELWELACGGPLLRCLVAKQSDAPETLLYHLEEETHRRSKKTPEEARDDNEVLYTLALNPSAPAGLLRRLESFCPVGVALHPNTPLDRLHALALGLEATRHSPREGPYAAKRRARGLFMLYGYLPRRMVHYGGWYSTAAALLLNPSTTKEILWLILQVSDWLLASAIAEHPNVTDELLSQLSTHESTSVRVSVARNRRTPKDALSRLLYDPHPRVAAAAVYNSSAAGPLQQNALRGLRRNPKKKRQRKGHKSRQRALLRRLGAQAQVPTHEKIFCRSFEPHKPPTKPRRRWKRIPHKEFFFEWLCAYDGAPPFDDADHDGSLSPPSPAD